MGCSLELASNRLQDGPLVKFRNVRESNALYTSKELWTEVYNLLLTVFTMHPYSNLKISIVRSCIFIERSLHL